MEPQCSTRGIQLGVPWRRRGGRDPSLWDRTARKRPRPLRVHFLRAESHDRCLWGAVRCASGKVAGQRSAQRWSALHEAGEDGPVSAPRKKMPETAAASGPGRVSSLARPWRTDSLSVRRYRWRVSTGCGPGCHLWIAGQSVGPPPDPS